MGMAAGRASAAVLRGDALGHADQQLPHALWNHGDSDYNGAVDFTDLLSLAQNYGNSLIRAEPRAPLFGRQAISTRDTLEPEETSLLA
jgi:hypothetical protein